MPEAEATETSVWNGSDFFPYLRTVRHLPPEDLRERTSELSLVAGELGGKDAVGTFHTLFGGLGRMRDCRLLASDAVDADFERRAQPLFFHLGA